MSAIRNKAWNLAQGDGRQYAKSSFTIDNKTYAKIHAHYLCGSDKIVVLEIDDAPECSDLDNLATTYCILTVENPTVKIEEAGRYIVARQVGRKPIDIKSLNAYVTVRKYNK